MQKRKALNDYYENPGLILPENIQEGEVKWKSPSNIALVKYWGKYGLQLPKNASLSMCLSDSYTETSIQYQVAKGKAQREFYFEGKTNEAFAKRIWKFIDSLDSIYPYLNQLDLLIHTQNSFPHSAGIASSASAMSALALCLVDIERAFFSCPTQDKDFFHKASYLARLGSGSASRSVYGGYAIWGDSKSIQENTDNKFAVPFAGKIHAAFENLSDAILIVDSGQKEVSSSLGHSLMEGHPFADDRVAQADRNLKELANAMIEGDKETFIKVVEAEALSLHALMMASDPWFILMKPETLKILQLIKKYRAQTRHFLCFTLDAGPNVHLIYGKENELEVIKFIEKELKPLCHQHQIIFDNMGKGPEKLI